MIEQNPGDDTALFGARQRRLPVHTGSRPGALAAGAAQAALALGAIVDGARHVDDLRRDMQHQRGFVFVGMAAVLLLQQVIGQGFERLPRYENSGYTRQVSWVDQTDYQLRKVEFYDRRGDLLKVLELTDYRRYDNGVWRAHRLSMNNLQTKKQTDLVYDDYRFDIDLDERDFVSGKLKRIR